MLKGMQQPFFKAREVHGHNSGLQSSLSKLTKYRYHNNVELLKVYI